MKLAVLLSGLNYIDVNDKLIESASKSLDSRQYVKNIKTYVYDFFTEKGYSIDTFICTNESPIIADVLKSYNPVRYTCIANTEDRRISKIIEVLRLLIEYMNETHNTYDMVCLTRLDIYFLQQLVNIDYTKLNIVSRVQVNKVDKIELLDDNFYLFPISMLDDIYNIYRTYRNYKVQGMIIMGGPSIIAHCFQEPFEEKCQIHYIKNEEPVLVSELSTFKLRFFDTLNLLVNKYIFTEGIEYYSRTKTVKMVIHDNKNITLTKLANGIYSWFGYTFDTGRYTLSFDILSDTDILIPFIKLHNPVIFHETGPIYANQLKTINLTITVRNMNTDLVFIFDNYGKSAVIQFKNISIEKIVKPLDLNVVVRGHFRTFEKTHQSLRKALSNTKHKIFMHTWDTVDANTASWHGNKVCYTNALTQEQRDLLNTFDDGYIIQSQSWTEQERNAIVLSRPYKTFLYFWQSIYECLYRIKEESQYILFTRYDIQVNIDFSDVLCEEDEIVIGYGHRTPNNVIPYGFTDIVFLIHYNDVYKLLSIPQKIIDLQTNMDPKYQIAEDPITDFFYSNWAKVTPKWLASRDITIIRPEASS